MAKKYVKKGGNGGARKGAGRPEGSDNALPMGTIAAIKALRHRVPDGTPKVLAEVAGRAQQRVVEVLEGKVWWQNAPSVLKAATMLRDEICGPLAQTIQHTGADGQGLVVQVITEPAPGSENDPRGSGEAATRSGTAGPGGDSDSGSGGAAKPENADSPSPPSGPGGFRGL